MMRWTISSRAASRQLLPADFLRRERGDDPFEPRIATERIAKSQQLRVAIAEVGVGHSAASSPVRLERVAVWLLNLQSRARVRPNALDHAATSRSKFLSIA